MTLAQRYEWSGTPFKAGLSPAAAHLRGCVHAADPQTLRDPQKYKKSLLLLKTPTAVHRRPPKISTFWLPKRSSTQLPSPCGRTALSQQLDRSFDVFVFVV